MTTGELKPKVFRESAIRNNGSGKIQFLRKSFVFIFYRIGPSGLQIPGYYICIFGSNWNVRIHSCKYMHI